jgi:hypothetical protein
MKLARLAGVAALALTASLGMTGAAHAAVGAPALATGLSSCPSSYLCFWNVQNYDGAMGKFSGDNADWSIFKTSNCSSGSWSNCAESAYNHGTNCTVYLFDYTSYQGLYHSLARGDRTPNMFGDYLNKVSSNRWCSPK